MKTVNMLVPRAMLQDFQELMELSGIDVYIDDEKQVGCAAVSLIMDDDMVEEHVCDDHDAEHASPPKSN